MTPLNLNLPDELQQFVTTQAEAGQFDGPASYVEALIRRAKAGNDQIETLAVEGLDSGEAIPLDDDEWQRIRAEVTQRLSNE